METIKQAIVQADTKLGGIPREYLYDGTNLIATDIVRVDGERYRMVDRKAEVGEKVIITDGEDKDRIGVVEDSYPEVGLSVDTGDDLSYYPIAWDGEYLVLEPMKVPEETPREPTDPLSEPPLTAYKIVDALTALSKTVAEQQREIDRLKALTEENAKNTLTFAEDLEEYKETTRLNEDNILGIYEDLGEVKSRQEHTQEQSSRVDLTTEFLISDLALITEKLLRITGGDGR